jgi:hypothetical protein
MSEQSGGYGPPQLEGYQVELAPPAVLGASSDDPTQAPVRFTLRGSNFVVRAMPLIITIGELVVQHYAIAPDGQSVICYLDALPEEGAVIRAGYPGSGFVELPERFSHDRLIS